MSLSNLFNIADSQYRALVIETPIVIFASYSWPWWVNHVTIQGAPMSPAAPIRRGLLEYTPYHVVKKGGLLLLAPATFSGQITASTVGWAPGQVGETLEYSNSPVSVKISAPTFNFHTGKYLVEVTGQDPLAGAISVNLQVTDNQSGTVNDAADMPGGGVVLFLQDPAYNQPSLTLWGPSFPEQPVQRFHV